MDQNETPLMRHIKREAKRLKKASPEMKLTKAQDLLAQKEGFKDWKDLRTQQLNDVENGGLGDGD